MRPVRDKRGCIMLLYFISIEKWQDICFIICTFYIHFTNDILNRRFEISNLSSEQHALTFFKVGTLFWIDDRFTGRCKLIIPFQFIMNHIVLYYRCCSSFLLSSSFLRDRRLCIVQHTHETQELNIHLENLKLEYCMQL